MGFELFFTSAQRGLKPGSRGFCTVAVTEGLSQLLADRLESLSGYRPVIPAADAGAEQNPVNHAHYRLSVGGRTWSVLSRVAFAGLDYSQRSNKFAHHVVVEPKEMARAGPAWVLSQPGVMQGSREGAPTLLSQMKQLPIGDQPAAQCGSWERVAGDAGWAGVLANTLMADVSAIVYLIVPPGVDMLPLMNEAIALLPPARRWQATFSTYFTDLPGDVQCSWRCVLAGTPMASQVQRGDGRAVILDLTQPRPLDKAGSGLVDAACTGVAGRAEDIEVQVTSAEPNGVKAEAVHARAQAVNGMGPDQYELEDPSTREPLLGKLGSTRGRPRHGEEPRRRGTSPAFWAAAILWPVLVAVVVFFLMQRGNAKTATSQPAPVTAASRETELTNQLAAETLRRQQAEQDRDKIRLDADNLKLSSSIHVSPEDRSKDAAAAAEERGRTVAQVAPTAAAAAAAPVEVTNTQPLPAPVKPSSEIVDPLAHVIVVPLPSKLTKPARDTDLVWTQLIPAVSLTADETVKVRLANGLEELENPNKTVSVKVTPWHDRQFTFSRTSRSSIAGGGSTELLILTLDNGRWSLVAKPEFWSAPDRDWLYGQFRICTLTLPSGATVQLFEPVSTPLDLTSVAPTKVQAKIEITPSDQLQLDTFGSSPGWKTQSSADGISFSRTVSGTDISFQVRAAGMLVSSTWRKAGIWASDPKYPEVQQAAVAKAKKELADEVEKNDKVRKNPELWKAEKGWREPKEASLKTVVDEASKSFDERDKEYRRLLEVQTAFREVGLVFVRLRLANGATVGILPIRTEEKE